MGFPGVDLPTFQLVFRVDPWQLEGWKVCPGKAPQKGTFQLPTSQNQAKTQSWKVGRLEGPVFDLLGPPAGLSGPGQNPHEVTTVTTVTTFGVAQGGAGDNF